MKILFDGTLLSTNDNPKFGIDGGNDTVDKVFIFGSNELYTYFDLTGSFFDGFYEKLVCEYTEYAKEKYIKNHAEEFDQSIEESATIYENEQKNNESSDHWCSWWTRTPGRWSSNFVIISLRGGGSSAGRVSSYSQGVRPAIWINIE